MYHSTKDYGLNEQDWARFCEKLDNNGIIDMSEICPARIITEHKSMYIVSTDIGELPASLSGKYRYEDNAEKPAVGDFAAIKLSNAEDRAVIYGIMPRKTCFYRADGSKSRAQVIASNFDTVFICMALNQDFNIPRLERYLILAKESGADIAVILTKSDICSDTDSKKMITEAVCGDIPVFAVSAIENAGLDSLRHYFSKGKTVVAVGSSGAGKSTLVNALFGSEIARTSEIRNDDGKGRHTTVSRQIIMLTSGGMYMDTPGLREVGLINAADGLSEVHGGLENIIAGCRFSDCSHTAEPGCAVQAAIENGTITAAQYERYEKQKKEAAYYDDKVGYMKEHARKFKQIEKEFRSAKKLKNK